MLTRANMFDVKANRRAFVLTQSAVLAPIAGPLAHELADRIFHVYGPSLFLRNVRALACRSVSKLNQERKL